MGLVEWFNGVFKYILKVYVVVDLLELNFYLWYVFFVYRKVLNEIIGFILFELFYVR